MTPRRCSRPLSNPRSPMLPYSLCQIYEFAMTCYNHGVVLYNEERLDMSLIWLRKVNSIAARARSS